MKSLAGLDELPAKAPELARAWIYARLIAFLIAEQECRASPRTLPLCTRQNQSQAYRAGVL